MKLLFAAVLLSLSVIAAAAQDDEDVQSWNDLQITIPVAKHVDALLLATFRFGNNISKLSEARGGAGLSFKINKAFSFSPSYLYIETRNTAGIYRTEHRVSLRGVYKFPFKKFGLSHRSIYEYRVRRLGNTWRYRPSLTFEKELPKSLMPEAKFFITEEPFYVSTTGKFSRNRFSLGISKSINPHLTLDLYYLRQNDGFFHPGDLNVIGTAWKVHL